LLDLPHNYGMDGRDIHALLVEDSASIRDLRHMSSDSGRGHKLCHV
jgi:hypothetical protein